MDTSDRGLMRVVEQVNQGVTGIDLKEMVDKHPRLLPLLDQAVDMSGLFESMSLTSFMVEGHTFSRYFSEIIIDTHRLYQYGIEVFESDEAFYGWLEANVTSMGGRIPLTLIDSFAGREWILRILTRIEHGVFS